MPVDETLINKRSEEVTGEDVRALLNAPSEEERPLIDPGVFDEKQPAQPIYKSIPLKLALAGVAALSRDGAYHQIVFRQPALGR